MRSGFWGLIVLNILAWSNELVAAQPNKNVTYIPNTYIVELDPQVQNSVVTPAAHFAQHIGYIDYQIRHEFNNTKYFYGLSLTVSNGTTQSTLRSATGVKNVWKVSIVPRPEPLATAPFTSAPQLNNVTLPHITGTGVDYLHPSLGGGFGPGYKIAFGYDFVGDDYADGNTPVPDDDPLTTCAGGGHGTHVSGIVGMVDSPDQGFGLVGVAPEATIGMYRIFGCSGGVSDDIIMAAMQQAVDDGADIISMSFGSITYWEQATPYPSFVQNIVNGGVAVIASAGNDGATGPFAVSSPALAPDAVSVGSVENERYTTVYSAQNNLNESIDYITVFPVVKEEPITVFWLGSGLGVPNNNTFADGCYDPSWTAARQAITDPEHTALLIFLDTCPLAGYQLHLQQIGITRLIYYTNDPDTPIVMAEPGTTGNYTIIMLEYEASQKIINGFSQLKDGQNYTLQFRGTDVHDIPNTSGGAMDYFSTIGPTIELILKPQISAPGGNILSLWPTSAGGYGVLSGTSMAAPFVAGCYALVKSQKPQLTVSQIVALLQSTSAPLNAFNSPILSPVAHQGAGLINVYNAIQADSLISPSQLSLLDSATPDPQTLTITNTANSTKIYTISHDAASYIRLFSDFTAGDIQRYIDFNLVTEAKYANAKFSQSQLTLGPGQSAKLQVQISPPRENLTESQPTYSGFIKLQSDSSNYSIPYLGVPYSRYEANYIAQNTKQALGVSLPELTSGVGNESARNIGTYNFYYLNGSFPTNLSVPLIDFYISQPTNFVRLEVVPANTSFVPTYYGFNPNVSIETHPPDLPLLPGFLNVPTYGVLVEFGIGEVPVSNIANILPWIQPYIIDNFVWLYPLMSTENGTGIDVQSGDYRPLLRVLRFGGNSSDPDAYQSWLGPILRAEVVL
ncbi:peptidase S8/S53 domain-containing protein [Xylogone sp. PMI_703]|nr:peptidase S8/S53 domain-containing protein [Xylogone sp. PMI_703]